MKTPAFIFSVLLSLGMIFLGVYLGYQGVYYVLTGMKTTATVVASRDVNESAEETSYIFRDQSDTLQSGSDRVFGLEAPREGKTINVYYLSNGRSTYVTPIDDIVLPLMALAIGILALKGAFMMRGQAKKNE